MFPNADDTQNQTNDNQNDAGLTQPGLASPSLSTTDDDDTTTATPSTAPAVNDDTPAPAAGGVATDELLTIKQEALQSLKPLVGHLDQTAEEKFRTTMMMIQAADDPHLIKPAYEAAKQITDEKTRAQALLDIVNEINYFSQQK